MSTRSSSLALGVVVLTAFASAELLAQEGPGLGVVATPAQVAGWALTILPDGTGLPPGSGTSAVGEIVYVQKCLACHGENGVDGINDRLVGGHGSITSDAPIKTVGSFWPYATTVFDYIRRAMPLTAPQSLTDDETYALTAYLLDLNDVIDADEVMNARTLPAVKMPNADNFFWAYSETKE